MSIPQIPALSVPIPDSTPIINGWKIGAESDPVIRKVVEFLMQNPSARLIPSAWADYLSNQSQATASSPQRAASVSILTEDASVGLTAFTTSGNSGLYRVSYLTTLDVPAATSSSVRVDITFTRNGNNKTFTGTNMNGNVVTEKASETWLVYPDPNTQISYEIFYASNPAGAAKYSANLVLETLSL